MSTIRVFVAMDARICLTVRFDPAHTDPRRTAIRHGPSGLENVLKITGNWEIPKIGQQKAMGGATRHLPVPVRYSKAILNPFSGIARRVPNKIHSKKLLSEQVSRCK